MNAGQYLDDWQDTNFNAIGEAIMFTLRDRDDDFTEEDFFERARNWDIPPELMERLCRRMFASFERTGYIEPTGETKVSERGGVRLPVWRRT